MLNNNTDIKEVDKLSPVLIMEAYFNLFHKFLIGVYMMPTTEMTVEIPPDQYKRRKGHIKIESGLNKYIFFIHTGMRIWSSGIIMAYVQTC